MTVSTGESTSLSDSISLELIDANAEMCESLLQQHIERLREARGVGWWRTCVYVAAESEGALEAATSAIRGVCTGRVSHLDPMRVVRPGAFLVRPAMIQGQMLTLRPREQSGGHVLGGAYDVLGTCVTSGELAVLINLPRRDIGALSG